MRIPGRALAVVGALTLGITAYSVFGGPASGSDSGSGSGRSASAPALGTAALPGGSLAEGISSLQSHLREQPQDAGGWAALGLGYVEQARISADPTRYPAAQQVLARSLALQPADNDGAHAGMAALDAARHEFSSALQEADMSLAINPYDAGALEIKVDALVELGRYPEAMAEVTDADQLRPGVPIYTRAAYVYELRGDVSRARQILADSLAASSEPSDVAYVASALGDLAWSQGDYKSAMSGYAAALRADATYAPALVGRGRTHAAQGDLADAIADLSAVTQRLPLPAYLSALGDVYDATGDHAAAQRTYDVVGAYIALAKANGVATDLDTALIAADHGDPAEALRAAQAEWSRRHSVPVADALAWALHANGRDAEALGYAQRADGAGYRNAAFLFHQGMIEVALGRRADATRDLHAALTLNPAFSLGDAAKARAVLVGWGVR